MSYHNPECMPKCISRWTTSGATIAPVPVSCPSVPRQKSGPPLPCLVVFSPRAAHPQSEQEMHRQGKNGASPEAHIPWPYISIDRLIQLPN